MSSFIYHKSVGGSLSLPLQTSSDSSPSAAPPLLALGFPSFFPESTKMSRLSSVLLLALCVVAAVSLDCRKFSFAPACRGLLLKRASAAQEFELVTKTCTTPSDVLSKVIEAAELAGYGDVIDMAFLRSFHNKALTETIAVQHMSTKA